MDSDQLRAVVRHQRGLLRRDQARACGYSAKQIRARLESGEWQPAFGPVLTMTGMRLTPELVDRAAQLAYRGSVLAGSSAARFYEIAVDRAQPCLIVPRSAERIGGVRLVVDRLERQDVRVIDGLRTTSAERTVLDCLLELPETKGAELLDRALLRRLTTLDRLSNQVRARVGRRGTPKLVRLIGVMAGGQRSIAERRLGTLLRQAHIRGWAANVPLSDSAGLIGVADVVFAAERLVVEVDGYAFHTTPDRFQRDRRRQNRLVAAGWTVLRFTWRDLVDRPAYVLATIRRLARR